MIGLSHNAELLLIALVGVIGLIILIARFNLNSFVALVLVSLFVGWFSGLELPAIARAFEEGVGAVLGSIAVVIGLGTILGKMLAESGGAEVVSETLVKAFGERWMHWTVLLAAFIVGFPVFFSVGLVLLAPIVFTLARQSRLPLLLLGIPMVAGLSVSHGLVPPHPGPMIAIGLLGADVGRTILYSLLIGIPTGMVAGPLFANWITRYINVEEGGAIARQLSQKSERTSKPGFGLVLLTIFLPIILMLLGTVVDIWAADENSKLRDWGRFLGHPVVALLIGVLFSLYSFGYARGFNRDKIAAFTNECVAPVALVLLVVGAGGGFSRVLVRSGVGEAMAEFAGMLPVSALLLGWIMAALIRVATGSATVAISTSAGLMAPVALATPGVNLELLVISMGAGSLILSHVNDGGFWLVKEYLNLSVIQTLKTWTVLETIISVVALLLVLLVDWLL
jgi:gluconate:H+ symporter, GntP family